MVIGIDASRAFTTNRTGTENYSYYLINELLRLPKTRTAHFVLFTRPGSVIPDWVRVSNAEVVVIPYRYLWTQVGLAIATWRYSLDVLWVPAHTLPILRKSGIKTVVTIHGLEYQYLPEYKNWLQRWYLPLSTYYAARSADKLIAVSQFTKDQLVAMGTFASKIEVVYEGVGQSGLVDQLAKEQKTSVYSKYQIENGKYILFVGTVQPRKNLPALIAAFARLSKDLPDIKLVIAGAKGWMTEEIYQTPQKLGIPERVVFAGRVDEDRLLALYQGAMVYVQPSLQEGFGLPVLEAMKNGIPVVTSDGGALPEVVGKSGVVVPLGSQFESELTTVLKKLLVDSNWRKELKRSGYERVKQFGWQQAAQYTFDVVNSLV